MVTKTRRQPPPNGGPANPYNMTFVLFRPKAKEQVNCGDLTLKFGG
jgi:hypothetical protein